MSSFIMVPLDGSELGERALPFAERLALAGSRQLILVRAADLFLPEGEVCIESEHPMLAEAHDYLQSIAARLASGLQVECVVPYRDAAREILTLVRARRPELVVMATHGRSGLGRWLYGSVADAVLRQSSVSVVLVPPDANVTPLTDRSVRMIIALDGSALAETALEAAIGLAPQLQAAVVLVRVGSSEKDVAEAQTYLAGVAERLRSIGSAATLDVRCRAELGFGTSPTIVRIADEEHADLIAMATHGRAGVPRFVLGSVATGTLRHASVPILLIGPANIGGCDTGTAR